MKIRRLVVRAVCLLCLWLGLGLQAHAQTDTVTYVYTDPQGTPLVKADASGNVIARYDYTPYGNSITSLGTAPNGPGYTGQVNDPETGLVYMQARYYGLTGRFLTPDSLEPAAGSLFSFNRYEYANDNPVINTDPTGRFPERNDGTTDQSNGDGYCDGLCQMENYGSVGYNGGKDDLEDQQQQQQQQLTLNSQNIIGGAAAKYNYNADAFEFAVVQAAGSNGIDPNILAGLGYRESSLNPSANNGGLFQIQNPSAYGMNSADIGNFAVQIPAAAKVLSSNIRAFKGNVNLGIAAWTLGVGGTRHLFATGGMKAVRSALLDKNHPDYGTVGPNYVDQINSFGH